MNFLSRIGINISHRGRAAWRWAVDFVTKKRRPAAEHEVVTAAAPSGHDPSPLDGVVQVPISRMEDKLRKLERARRKHDKFVVPKGERPKRTRAQSEEVKPKLPRTERVVDESVSYDTKNAEHAIADKHHDDRDGDDVLYKEAELYGEFNFRDTILQQLDRYFFYLKRMKKSDPGAYGLYRQVGATLLPYIATGADNRQTIEKDTAPEECPPLAPWFNAARPSFGCYAYGADPETEKHEEATSNDARNNKVIWVPKLLYFTKYKSPPPEVEQASGGDVYMLTVVWDRPSEPKCVQGIPQQMAIFISRDGKEVHALRTIDTKFVPVRSKRGGTFVVPSRAWRFPGDYESWAKAQGYRNAQHFLTYLFLTSVNRHERGQLSSVVRISVIKNDMTAVFTVNARRTAYFFQDRDISISGGGSRKRIFHMVRPHMRADGSAVKLHFRGERDFTWAGYKVQITIPGLDHPDFNEFDIGAMDEYWASPRKSLSMIAVGKRLADTIRQRTQRVAWK